VGPFIRRLPEDSQALACDSQPLWVLSCPISVFTDEKTRSALSVGRSRIYSIVTYSVALNDVRLRFNIPRITVVSCFSFLTLAVLVVIAVLSSFIPGPGPGPGPTAHPTSVVVVLPAEDGARCRASLYDRRPGFFNLS
jgi:hypothetical protein